MGVDGGRLKFLLHTDESPCYKQWKSGSTSKMYMYKIRMTWDHFTPPPRSLVIDVVDGSSLMYRFRETSYIQTRRLSPTGELLGHSLLRSQKKVKP